MRKADVGLQFADTIKLSFSGSYFRQREPAAPEYFPPQQKPAPGDQGGLSNLDSYRRRRYVNRREQLHPSFVGLRGQLRFETAAFDGSPAAARGAAASIKAGPVASHSAHGGTR